MIVTESGRERIRRERREIIAEYGDLFHRVAEILGRHDPMGLHALGCPDDEYYPEVGTILPRLKECSCAEDAHRVVYEEFVRWFDGPNSRVADDKSCYEGPALEIWDAWTKSALS